MIRVRTLVIGLVCVLGTLSSGRASADEFPAAIQQRLDDGSDTILELASSIEFMRIFRLTDLQDSSVQYLIRYRTGANSNHQTYFDGNKTAFFPLYGAVWMLIEETYGNNQGGDVIFYMEQIDPIEYPIGNFYMDEIRVSMGREALLDSAGFFVEDVDGGGGGNIYIDGIIICLAEGCEIGGSVSLIGTAFIETDGGNIEIVFPVEDGRTELFSQYALFPGFDKPPFKDFETSQTFEIGIGTEGLGDLNRDGRVDLLDVSPFVDALTSGCYVYAADVNQDGFVSLSDVNGFIELLTGQ